TPGSVGPAPDRVRRRRGRFSASSGGYPLRQAATRGSGPENHHRPVSPMRELDRRAADTSTPVPGSTGPSARVGIVGAGRVGHALARGLEAAGRAVEGPLGRGEAPDAEVVLLCVPDSEIGAAAE